MTRYNRPLIWFFLVAEAILYGSFLALDLFAPWVDTRAPKYLSILLCLVVSLYLACRGGDKLVALAMSLTLGADTLLLLLDRWYGLGIALFFGVQLVYCLRLRPLTGRFLFWVWVGLFFSLLPPLACLHQLTPLNVGAALYISLFFLNIPQSLFWSGREGRWFTAGLILYFLCDLCVAVHNAPGLFPSPFGAFARVGMWLFYLPGQVLIVLSARKGVGSDDKTK